MLDAVIRRIPDGLLALRVAVVMGGPSPEREVSLRSGTRVLKALQRLGFQVAGLDADRTLARRLLDGGFGIVFLATHGVPGEDGSFQGLLEHLGLPYTGAGVVGSALALDKLAAKALLEKEGVPTPAWRLVEREQPLELAVKDLARCPGFPMVLKPVDGGSSIGVRVSADLSELRTALEQLLPAHERLFAEACVRGRELTVSVLEDPRGRPYGLPVLELEPKNLFYDYESKTVQGKAEFRVPAVLPAGVAERAVALSLLAHRRLLQRDFSRSDFMLDREDRLWYLETNSIPGLTDLSDLPAQAKAGGLLFEEVVAGVLAGAYRRGSMRGQDPP